MKYIVAKVAEIVDQDDQQCSDAKVCEVEIKEIPIVKMITQQTIHVSFVVGNRWV
jgi:hypothetical protein